MKYTGLKPLLKTFDNHGWKGSFTRDLWSIANGGYDMWFLLSYKGFPVAECIAGKLSSSFGLSPAEKDVLFNRILEVYDHLTIQDGSPRRPRQQQEYTIVDRFDTETEKFFTVELKPEFMVDVKVIPETGLIYVMDNGDGSTVYTVGDGTRDNTYPDYEYDQASVIALVKEALCTERVKDGGMHDHAPLSDIISSAQQRAAQTSKTQEHPAKDSAAER